MQRVLRKLPGPYQAYHMEVQSLSAQVPFYYVFYSVQGTETAKMSKKMVIWENLGTSTYAGTGSLWV